MPKNKAQKEVSSDSEPELSEEQDEALKLWKAKGKFSNSVDCDAKPIRTGSLEDGYKKLGIKLGKVIILLSTMSTVETVES